MLSDDASINKINPFIVNEFNLPGTKSEPFAFRDYENPHKENDDLREYSTPLSGDDSSYKTFCGT